MTIQERTIDFSNFVEEDLVIKNVTGGSLTIQLDGEATITLMGKCTELETYYNLGIINLTSLSKQDNISAGGVYMSSISGLDQIKLVVEEEATGKLHMKEMA